MRHAIIIICLVSVALIGSLWRGHRRVRELEKSGREKDRLLRALRHRHRNLRKGVAEAAYSAYDESRRCLGQIRARIHGMTSAKIDQGTDKPELLQTSEQLNILEYHIENGAGKIAVTVTLAAAEDDEEESGYPLYRFDARSYVLSAKRHARNARELADKNRKDEAELELKRAEELLRIARSTLRNRHVYFPILGKAIEAMQDALKTVSDQPGNLLREVRRAEEACHRVDHVLSEADKLVADLDGEGQEQLQLQ